MRIVMPTSRDRSAARRALIRQLLADGGVSSQAELAALLAAHGHPVSQTTVSRDLVELGATKTAHRDHQSAYILAGDGLAGDESLERLEKVLREYFEAALPSGNLVVLKVRVATAGAVAAALDAASPEGVLGTIAGDDTVLVVTDESVGGQRVANNLVKILER